VALVLRGLVVLEPAAKEIPEVVSQHLAIRHSILARGAAVQALLDQMVPQERLVALAALGQQLH
tara:strand:- start:784 stop:975 length:192 start_codon:yes stop_codon:yes gene_type:complete